MFGVYIHFWILKVCVRNTPAHRNCQNPPVCTRSLESTTLLSLQNLIHQPQPLRIQHPQPFRIHQPQPLVIHQPQPLRIHQSQPFRIHQPQSSFKNPPASAFKSPPASAFETPSASIHLNIQNPPVCTKTFRTQKCGTRFHWLARAVHISVVVLKVQVQCCFTSTETTRNIKDGEPRTATWTFTQLLSSESNDGERPVCMYLAQTPSITTHKSHKPPPDSGAVPASGLGYRLVGGNKKKLPF